MSELRLWRVEMSAKRTTAPMQGHRTNLSRHVAARSIVEAIEAAVMDVVDEYADVFVNQAVHRGPVHLIVEADDE